MENNQRLPGIRRCYFPGPRRPRKMASGSEPTDANRLVSPGNCNFRPRKFPVQKKGTKIRDGLHCSIFHSYLSFVVRSFSMLEFFFFLLNIFAPFGIPFDIPEFLLLKIFLQYLCLCSTCVCSYVCACFVIGIQQRTPKATIFTSRSMQRGA